MPTGQTLGVPILRGETLDDLRREVQDWLIQLANHADTMAGARGTPKFQAAPDLNGLPLQNVRNAIQEQEATTKAQSFTLAMNPENARAQFDARGFGIFNLPAGDHALDAINLGQLPGTLQDILRNNPNILPFADPTATIGLTVIPGSAGTIMRSDAAPPLSQAIAPTWTGLHTFNRGAAAPFAVDAASLKVTNLDADKLDGFDEAAFGKLADAETVTGVWNFSNGLQVGGNETALLYDEGSFTMTGTGFAANPTGTVNYLRWGKLVVLQIPLLSGTSNATTFTLTGLPAALTPTLDTYPLAYIVDNGTPATGNIIMAAASATFTVYPNPAGGPWTSSGVKALEPCCLVYTIL